MKRLAAAVLLLLACTETLEQERTRRSGGLGYDWDPVRYCLHLEDCASRGGERARECARRCAALLGSDGGRPVGAP